MALIVDKSFFFGEIFIPNVSSNTDSLIGQSQRDNDLSAFIDMSEREFLIDYGLGVEVYERFANAFDQDGNLPDDADPNIVALLDGETYTLSNGKKARWDGLAFMRGSKNFSLIAYWIFYNWMQQDVLQKTIEGVSALKGKNAEKLDPDPILVSAFRNFHKMFQGTFKRSCNYNRENTPRLIYSTSGVFLDYYQSERSGLKSMLQYINDKISLDETLKDEGGFYHGWEYSILDNINSFGV